MYLSAEEIQALKAGKSILDIQEEREVRRLENVIKRGSYQLYLKEREERLETAQGIAEETGFTRIPLSFNELLLKGFDSLKDSTVHVNRTVVARKGQFEWFSECGIYWNADDKEFVYVSSKKVKKDTWIQKMYPLTEAGHDLAMKLASK